MDKIEAIVTQWQDLVRLVFHIVDAALALILLLGLVRWAVESRENRNLAAIEHRKRPGGQCLTRRRALDLIRREPPGKITMASYWPRIYLMFYWQNRAARLFLLAALALMLLFALGFPSAPWSGWLPAWLHAICACLRTWGEQWMATGWFLTIASIGLLASLCQTLLNRLVPGTSGRTVKAGAPPAQP